GLEQVDVGERGRGEERGGGQHRGGRQGARGEGHGASTLAGARAAVQSREAPAGERQPPATVPLESSAVPGARGGGLRRESARGDVGSAPSAAFNQAGRASRSRRGRLG